MKDSRGSCLATRKVINARIIKPTHSGFRVAFLKDCFSKWGILWFFSPSFMGKMKGTLIYTRWMFCYSVSLRVRAWYTGKQSNANGRGHYSKGISVDILYRFLWFLHIYVSAPSRVNVKYFLSEYHMERHENKRAVGKQIVFK